MGLFDDFSKFLETRLEEFLSNNPHLELQALDEQLREQEQETVRLISNLQLQEKRHQDEILAVAQEIQTWHSRIGKAQAAGRVDLANAAQEREAALLRQGNALWGQMQGAKNQLGQAQVLLSQIRQRKQELQVKIAQVKASQAQSSNTSNSQTTGWNQGANYSYGNYKKSGDPLEEQFLRWEVDDELERMKRDLGS